jgi:hypothetical protein
MGRHTNNVELGKYGRNRSNVWCYDSAAVQARKGNNLLALHPTAKPVQLVMDALLDCSRRGKIVLDRGVTAQGQMDRRDRTSWLRCQR